MPLIVGTAGHVDHGKTTLIRALTGIETDRLREEQERGLSVVPGFAFLDLPLSGQVGFVDVPGHERFLHNMLTGISGVDAVLLVVAADEGVMPQTREHLHICHLLRLRHGLVVLSRADRADAARLQQTRAQLETLVAGTFLEGAPAVAVAPPTGAGMEELLAQIDTMCARVLQQRQPQAPWARPFVMAVDRAFTMPGFGVVVTGSAATGQVATNDSPEVWLCGAERSVAARVRGIQVHGRPMPAATRGQRVALNLTGLDSLKGLRGATVATPGFLTAAHHLDVWLEILSTSPAEETGPLRDGQHYRLHTGTSELGVRLRLWDGQTLAPGKQAVARFKLDQPLAVAPGRRFVLRAVSSERVLGGGTILAVNPARHPNPNLERSQRLNELLEQEQPLPLARWLLDEAGTQGMTTAELSLQCQVLDPEALLPDLQPPPWHIGDRWLSPDARQQIQTDMLHQLDVLHREFPREPAIARQTLLDRLNPAPPTPICDSVLAELHQAGVIVLLQGTVRRSSHQPVQDEVTDQVRDEFLSHLRQAGFAAPTVDELVASAPERTVGYRALKQLLGESLAVQIDNWIFDAGVMQTGAHRIVAHLQTHAGLTLEDARGIFGVTRKWLVPILEYYDRQGLTRREGNMRVMRGKP